MDREPLTAEEVRNVVFDKAPLGRRGYREQQVDDFLDRIEAALEGRDTLTAAEVRDVAFEEAPRIRRGYHEQQVDSFLDIVVVTLEQRERGTGTRLRPAAADAGGQPPPPTGTRGRPGDPPFGRPDPNGYPDPNDRLPTPGTRPPSRGTPPPGRPVPEPGSAPARGGSPAGRPGPEPGPGPRPGGSGYRPGLPQPPGTGNRVNPAGSDLPAGRSSPGFPPAGPVTRPRGPGVPANAAPPAEPGPPSGRGRPTRSPGNAGPPAGGRPGGRSPGRGVTPRPDPTEQTAPISLGQPAIPPGGPLARGPRLSLPIPPAPPGAHGYRANDVERLAELLTLAVQQGGPTFTDLMNARLNWTPGTGQGYHTGVVDAILSAWVSELRRRSAEG